MPLLISDANIVIDLEAASLTAEMFRLKDTIAVPDLLFEEELRAQHHELLELGLKLMSLEANTIRRVEELASLYPRPGRIDLTALALAEQERCALLTGDKHLRAAAEEEGVLVRGTLWVCECMVEGGLITPRKLREAYERMKSADRRLPWIEVEDQLQRLRA